MNSEYQQEMRAKAMTIDINLANGLQIAKDSVKLECKRLNIKTYKEFQTKIKEIEND